MKKRNWLKMQTSWAAYWEKSWWRLHQILSLKSEEKDYWMLLLFGKLKVKWSLYCASTHHCDRKSISSFLQGRFAGPVLKQHPNIHCVLQSFLDGNQGGVASLGRWFSPAALTSSSHFLKAEVPNYYQAVACLELGCGRGGWAHAQFHLCA